MHRVLIGPCDRVLWAQPWDAVPRSGPGVPISHGLTLDMNAASMPQMAKLHETEKCAICP